MPDGRTPISHIFVEEGSKAYVLIPKAKWRKDSEDKAMVGYFFGFSKNKVGHRVFLVMLWLPMCMFCSISLYLTVGGLHPSAG